MRYVPELKRKLLSKSMFDDLGYCIIIECGVLEILHGALIMAKGSKTCGLYTLDGSTVIGHASVVSQYLLDKSKLWNLRAYE